MSKTDFEIESEKIAALDEKSECTIYATFKAPLSTDPALVFWHFVDKWGVKEVKRQAKILLKDLRSFINACWSVIEEDEDKAIQVSYFTAGEGPMAGTNAYAVPKDRKIKFNLEVILDHVNSTEEAFLGGLMGIAAHELGHVCISKLENFSKADTIFGSMVLNFLEDERVEDFFREKFPAYRKCFHYSIEKFFLEPFRAELDTFAQESPTVQMMRLVSLYLRSPEEITDEQKELIWAEINVYENLQRLMPSRLKTQEEVENKTEEICNFFSDAAVAFLEKIDDNKVEKLEVISPEKFPSTYAVAVKRELEYLEKIFLSKKDSVDQATSGDSTKKILKRIGIPSSEDALEADAYIAEEVEESDTEEADNLTVTGDAWDNLPRPCYVLKNEQDIKDHVYSYGDCLNEEDILNQVSLDATKLRNIFSLRFRKKVVKYNEQLEGRVHRRKLARAGLTKRIFQVKEQKSQKGASIAVLLDASGSMAGRKADNARKVGYLLAKAFKDLPHVNIQIYSHTSDATNRKAAVLACLYGPYCDSKEPYGLLRKYSASAENYDHVAIKHTTDLFLKSSPKTDQKILIVVSDGMPCGENYYGPSAEKAVRKEVIATEKQGVFVTNVAIEDFKSEKMYSHTIKFLNPESLVRSFQEFFSSIGRKIFYES